MARKNLPVKISKEIQRIEDVILPSIYKAPTDLAIINKARSEYFTIDSSEDSYAEVCDSYLKLKNRNSTSKSSDKLSIENKEKTEESKAQFLPATIKEKKALSVILSRDSLEEYRREYNLDKLREKLIEEIVNFASFEEGLRLLSDHIHKNVSPSLDSKTQEEIFEKNDPYYNEKSLICKRYPDITADEVTWFSLVKFRKDQFVYDIKHSFFNPHSLIDMDLGGLLFSFEPIDEIELDSIKADSPYKIGGFTGVDYGIAYQPFIHNISQAIKAIMLLKLSDNDLFEKIIQQEDIAPFMHGDTMLLKSFLRKSYKNYGIENTDNRTLEEIISDSSNTFTKNSISDLRKEIINYFEKCKFRNKQGNSYNTIDSIKILGTLSKLPQFIEKGEQFDSYVMFYGNNIEFISSNGKIIDSVSLIDYLKYKIAYQFHDRFVSIDKKEQLVRDIFNELRERIIEKNIEQNNKMALDELQEKMLTEFGIFFPIEVYSHLKEVSDSVEMYIRYSSDKKYIERTVKFSYKEINTIYEILKTMPKPFIKNISSVSKKVTSEYDIDMFKNGLMKGGEYNPKNKRIEIRIPSKTPIEKPLLEYYIKYNISKGRKNKNKILEELLEAEFHESYITHIFLHEVGESIRNNLNQELWNKWLSISSDVMNIEQTKRDKYFLSRYATTSPHEDFCETFSFYILFGKEFKEKAKKSPALKAKYEFMQKLFSIDGIVREFSNRYNFPMQAIAGNPRKEMEKIEQEEILKTLKEEEKVMELEERLIFGDVAFSYEGDVLNIIEEHEAKGESISREEATRIAKNKKQEYDEGREEFIRKERIYKKVYNISLEMLLEGGLDVYDANKIYDELSNRIFENDKKECANYLIEKGLKKSYAKKVVDKLHPLFKAFEDEIRSKKIKMNKDELDEIKEITVALREEMIKSRKK